MSRKRSVYLAIVLLLLAVLGGLVFLYLSFGREAPAAKVTQVAPGLKHVRSVYSWGEGADKLIKQPFGVAYRDGRLYVSQMEIGNVLVFAEDFDYLYTIGKKGSGPGELATTGGVEVDGAGNVYVADTSNAKIVVYTPDGKLVKEIPVTYPLVPRVFEDQRLYVTSFDSIKVFSLPGYEEISSWGRRGRQDAEYDFPNGIAIGDAGETIYVSDGNNLRLKRLNREGENVWIVGKPPEDILDTDRIFGLPAGMVLVDGVLYIVDPLNGRVHLYDSEKGTKLGEVGQSGPEEGQFSYPSHIAHLGGQRFAITEWGNDRVQIVEIDPRAIAAEEKKQDVLGSDTTGSTEPAQ